MSFVIEILCEVFNVTKEICDHMWHLQLKTSWQNNH
jgi:hypothetical protein